MFILGNCANLQHSFIERQKLTDMRLFYCNMHKKPPLLRSMPILIPVSHAEEIYENV